ncbi:MULTISPECIES: fumarylacetoacetate hydrolase family protein [unclassified Pseudoclavibacter]|uniref:fumarylacetoacetate hydrolase family protein n=1 Tax=unclassified Pseudoclavibacter TaxID=2615177 RepID=UPI001BA77F30|nr:fumarylacetoacetate hydrolase family protein [Pseudoclavibacter sp. Marseille-Q4354]MBS3178208.1 fumarylacetoacetate hydrolase family protein [Pseudoclavibacter sp. Marseille-Q4354]
MRFLRLGDEGSEVPVLRVHGIDFDLSGVTADLDGEFFETDGIARAKAAHAAGELPVLDGSAGLRVGAPVARPSAIVCVGMNYAAHAAESGAAPPSDVIVFLKTPNTISGPFDDVPLPQGSEKSDWEVELGVVISKRVSYLESADEAMDAVAGFVVGNDLSERAWQLEAPGGQWSKGKSAPRFSPLGPELVTPDEVDFRALRLWSTVNGEPRQDSSTADMIFDVPHIIWTLSQYLALEPGDVVLTGTPEGVALSGRFPYLRVGDVVELGIDGLGSQRQVIV